MPIASLPRPKPHRLETVVASLQPCRDRIHAIERAVNEVDPWQIAQLRCDSSILRGYQIPIVAAKRPPFFIASIKLPISHLRNPSAMRHQDIPAAFPQKVLRAQGSSHFDSMHPQD